MKTRLSLSLLLALAGAAALPAQTRVVPNADEDTLGVGATADEPRAPGALASEDQKFFDQIATLNQKELLLSRVALERSTRAEVRAYADDMVREHSAASEQLNRLALRKGARLDPDDAEKARKMEEKWAKKSGAELDEAYVEAMVEAHEKTVETLEKGSRSTDADIAAFASELLPKVRSHLERAKELKKTVDD